MPVFNLKNRGQELLTLTGHNNSAQVERGFFLIYLTVYRHTIARNNRFLNGHGHGCGH